MTLVQSYHCKSCNYSFGPIGVGPYMKERPQVFRYCRDCGQGQTLIAPPGTLLKCAHCQSPQLVDVQENCPKCSSTDVHWESQL